MKVTYKCIKCGEFTRDLITKPPFTSPCPKCGQEAPRTYGGQVTTTAEDPSVSGAIQMMLYSTN